MKSIKTRVLALTLILGAAMVFSSCKKDTLPKSYDLVADEYKEILLDPLLEINLASIPQDQGETFTIESPKPGAQLTIHYYRPDNAGQEVTPVVYYCHGGGYQTGSATMYTATTSARWPTGSEPRRFLWNIR